MISRLSLLFLVGCGITSVRLQPTETVSQSTFALPGVLCEFEPIVFDVSFERQSFLKADGQDLKIAKAKTAEVSLSAEIADLSAFRDCAPHGAVTLAGFVLSYDIPDKGGTSHDYSCAVDLDLGGDQTVLLDRINRCLNEIADDKERAVAIINDKPTRVRFVGKGTCATDACGALTLDVKMTMKGVDLCTGTDCEKPPTQ